MAASKGDEAKKVETPWVEFANKKNAPHCVKSVRIWSYSGLYFAAFGLNAERYEVFLRIQSECGKIRTRIAPNTDTFHVVSCANQATLD